MKLLLAAAAILFALATVPASAGCYEHCHDDGHGNTTCHVNCY
jgi:hypothetical protein